MARSPGRSLEQRFWRHWCALVPPAPGARVLVSVSGGSDSLALLLLLHGIAGRVPLHLEVVHFDHGLRPESAGEAEWVAERARRLALPFHLRRHDALAGRASGLQAAARQWRRRESLRLLETRGARWIATGHQREDHLETLLLKLLRGVHLARLRGLEPVRGPWLRPLLAFGREELRAYLRGRDEAWLEDPSNTSPRYKRNRVRLELMPLLDELADGGTAARLAPLERQSRELAALLEACPAPAQGAPAGEPPWIEVAGLMGLPALARQHHLHAFIQRHLPGLVEAARVAEADALLARGAPSWRLDLSGWRSLQRLGGRLLLRRRDGRPGWREVRLGPWRLEAEGDLEVGPGGAAHPAGTALPVHNLTPGQRLVLRRRRRGDRFHPPWRERAVRLSDFLRERRVPLWQRERLPVLEADGRIVAVWPRWAARGHERPAGSGEPLTLSVRLSGAEGP